MSTVNLGFKMFWFMRGKSDARTPRPQMNLEQIRESKSRYSELEATTAHESYLAGFAFGSPEIDQRQEGANYAASVGIKVTTKTR